MNGPSEICRRQPLKNFTWSILEYFVSNNDRRITHLFVLFRNVIDKSTQINFGEEMVSLSNNGENNHSKFHIVTASGFKKQNKSLQNIR